MNVLSHRGYWNTPKEKNTPIAFERAFSNGFGIETDIRDYKGELVIAHEIADEKSILLKSLFDIYKSFDDEFLIALNIKANGLQEKIKKLLEQYEIVDYFVFDMSIPDSLQYLKLDIKFFTRQSEFEKEPSFYESATGVWLDEFHSRWIDKKTIEFHLKNSKKICIASPELHERKYLEEWKSFKQIEKEIGLDNLIICTDCPKEARRFFDEV